MPRPTVDQVSAVLRRNDVLEPWVTESHWDEGYWNGEAKAIVERLGSDPTRAEGREAVAATLTQVFRTAGFARSSSGSWT